MAPRECRQVAIKLWTGVEAGPRSFQVYHLESTPETRPAIRPRSVLIGTLLGLEFNIQINLVGAIRVGSRFDADPHTGFRSCPRPLSRRKPFAICSPTGAVWTVSHSARCTEPPPPATMWRPTRRQLSRVYRRRVRAESGLCCSRATMCGLQREPMPVRAARLQGASSAFCQARRSPSRLAGPRRPPRPKGFLSITYVYTNSRPSLTSRAWWSAPRAGEV